jgi:hypothetical protein
MAWKEQCKIALVANTDALVNKERKKHGAITRVLKRLAKESDIPFNTLNCSVSKAVKYWKLAIPAIISTKR